MTILEDVTARCKAWDAARPRSSQVEVGWSEVGGCRAAMGFRLTREWATDEPDKWAALRGTIIHLFLESLMDGDGEVTEVATSYRGIPGHADLVVASDGVYDFKTTTLANSRAWRSSEAALLPKRVQANGYAAGLVDAGVLPDDCAVGLIIIPVDGTYDDWWLFEEPFSRVLADAGADRLESVQRMLANGETLPKDEPYAWCARWCEFFSVCRDGDSPSDGEEITSPELVALIDVYGQAVAAATAAGKVKDQIGPQIRGLRGVAGAWKIGVTKAGEPKTALDEEWIRADYAARGLPVPEITVPGVPPKLTVRRVKA